MFSRNVDFGPPLRLSSFRKVAIGTWRTAGDPGVYGVLEVDAGPALKYVEALRARTGARITMSHLVGKIIAETLRRHPDVNVTLRCGRLYPRKTADIFFQVAVDSAGKELSGMVVRAADTKSIPEICVEMEKRVDEIRNKGDPAFRKMKGTMKLLPGFLTPLAVGLTGWLMYGLNLWSPLLGTPRDPFGSVMITNIGSLGLDQAFAPLVPYSRVPILIALGAPRETPVVRDGKIVIAPILKLCTTFDHRVIDGMVASKMARSVSELFADPAKAFDASGA